MKSIFSKLALTAALALAIAFTFSCSSGFDDDSGGGGQRKITQLSDRRFNGEFWNYGTGNAFVMFSFDGTSKGHISINTYHYIYDIEYYIEEWEISNGKIRSRRWDDNANVNNTWSSWDNYSFSSDGNVLTLSGSVGTTSYTKR